MKKKKSMSRAQEGCFEARNNDFKYQPTVASLFLIGTRQVFAAAFDWKPFLYLGVADFKDFERFC